MSKNIIFWFTLELILFCCPITQVFSEEQCVANYDVVSNVVSIPCVTIGDTKIWVNLKLATPDTLLFEVNNFGEGFLPLWLTQMINEFEEEPVTNPPRVISQSRYNEKIVYYVTSPCCDQFNYLYDTTGTVICAPDGGFTGKGDGQCSDFGDISQNRIMVWKDPRKLESPR